jgi:hypothetical protein
VPSTPVFLAWEPPSWCTFNITAINLRVVALMAEDWRLEATSKRCWYAWSVWPKQC